MSDQIQDEPQTPPEARTGKEVFRQYALDDKMKARLENDFTYHAPKGIQPERYSEMREAHKALAIYICENTPPGREQSRCLTALEDSMYSANAAIARGE